MCVCVCVYIGMCLILLQINKLSRWQVIDKVREHSTEAAKSGDGGVCILS